MAAGVFIKQNGNAYNTPYTIRGMFVIMTAAQGSVWSESIKSHTRPPLEDDIAVDVLIVGATKKNISPQKNHQSIQKAQVT